MNYKNVYIVIDSALSMTGKPIDDFKKLILNFITQRKKCPYSLEKFKINIISSNEKGADFIIKDYDLVQFNYDFKILCEGKSDIFKGIDLFMDDYLNIINNKNNIKRNITRSYLFLLVGTIPYTDFTNKRIEFFKKYCEYDYSLINFSLNHNSDSESYRLFKNPYLLKNNNVSITVYNNVYVLNYYNKYFDEVKLLTT